MLLPISSGSVHGTLISGNSSSCATQKRGVPFTSSVVLKQRNAKDAKTSVVECYTGGVDCAGADDSVGALSGGRSLRLSALHHKHSQYILTREQKRC
jgi:hypothetical protein